MQEQLPPCCLKEVLGRGLVTRPAPAAIAVGRRTCTTSPLPSQAQGTGVVGESGMVAKDNRIFNPCVFW